QSRLYSSLLFSSFPPFQIITKIVKNLFQYIYYAISISTCSIIRHNKNGVATFFLPRYIPATTEPGCLRGKFGFLWVSTRYESCTYKNTTCTLRNNREGLYRNVP